MMASKPEAQVLKLRYFGLKQRLVLALKGPNSIAQGNALGHRDQVNAKP